MIILMLSSMAFSLSISSMRTLSLSLKMKSSIISPNSCSFPQNLVSSTTCLLFSSASLKSSNSRLHHVPTNKHFTITAFSLNKQCPEPQPQPQPQHDVESRPWLFSENIKLERALICWFVFTGLIHIIVEGYLVFTPNIYDEKSGVFLAEIWKEYSKGDSRYASFDSGVVALEWVTTVVWGPTCLITAYAIATHKSYRYVLQLVVSLGHIYGVVIYYLTAILEGDHFSASSFHYYAYYIASNIPWILIPFLVIIRCWRKMCEIESKDTEKIL